MIRASLTALAILVLLPAGAAAAVPPVCEKATIRQTLLDAGKLTEEGIKFDEDVDLVRCGDVTGDGAKDALFTVYSGGTAGDTHFGVLRGGDDGSAGALILYRSGYNIGIDRRNRRSFEVIQPHYRKNDANCCPSSFRIRRHTWTGSRFKAGKLRKSAKAPRRFYRR